MILFLRSAFSILSFANSTKAPKSTTSINIPEDLILIPSLLAMTPCAISCGTRTNKIGRMNNSATLNSIVTPGIINCNPIPAGDLKRIRNGLTRKNPNNPTVIMPARILPIL